VLAKDPNVTITNKGYEFQSPIAWLEINNRIKPLNDKRVRKAILTALDREFIVRTIFAGQCKVARGADRFGHPRLRSDRAEDRVRPEGRRGAAGRRGAQARRRRRALPY
jgi:ABC-type oligopeptide transport system substrate-binding subunit